ncbi:acyl-CoA carboxylase subunit epsilon [Streptomyces sp. NPDC050264]|uniref:acyl-CoA carboxylase subunit epsilon n=1 Tax=Streptomyces sp. NPDC050264 TaxID=3155038 RepID=UPI003433C94C
MGKEGSVLRVVRGHADEVELAALTAVLLVLSRGCGAAEEAVEEFCSSWWTPSAEFAPPGSWR